MRFSVKPGDVSMDPAGMSKLTGPGPGADKLMRSTARQTLSTAQMRSPVDTGQLRMSHRIGNTVATSRNIKTEINVDKEYAIPVHEGTAARVIRPRNAKALRFVVGGNVVFATRVNMPARAGRPWLFNALQSVAGGKGFNVTRGG